MNIVKYAILASVLALVFMVISQDAATAGVQPTRPMIQKASAEMGSPLGCPVFSSISIFDGLVG